MNAKLQQVFSFLFRILNGAEPLQQKNALAITPATLREKEPREQPKLTKSGSSDSSRTPPAAPQPDSGRRLLSEKSAVRRTPPAAPQPDSGRRLLSEKSAVRRTPPAAPQPFSGKRLQSDGSGSSSTPLSKQRSASERQRLSANSDRRKMPPGTQLPVKLGRVRNALPSSLLTQSAIA